MSKPKWEDAPDWAMWLAADQTDDEGRPECWVWFECEPVWDDDGWLVGQHGTNWQQLTNHKVQLGYDAINSLERRP